MPTRPLIAALTLLAVAATSGALAADGRAPEHDVENITKDEILQVIRAAKARFSECYREAVGRRTVRSGKVTVRFTIAPTGEVATAEISGSSFDDTTFHACLLDVVRRLRFSRFRGERLVITYPLVFRPEEADEGRRPPPDLPPSRSPEPPPEPAPTPEEPGEEPPAPGEEPDEPDEPPAPGEEPDEPDEPPAPGEEPDEPEEPPAPGEEPDESGPAVRPPAPR